jgi:hypothetical protein
MGMSVKHLVCRPPAGGAGALADAGGKAPPARGVRALADAGGKARPARGVRTLADAGGKARPARGVRTLADAGGKARPAGGVPALVEAGGKAPPARGVPALADAGGKAPPARGAGADAGGQAGRALAGAWARGGAAALLSAVLALAAPTPPDSAAAALSTSVSAASVAGPNAAMTEGDAGVSCAKRLVSGGGARMDQSVLSNGVHLVGSFPSSDRAAQSADGELSPTAWIAAGGIGGQAASAVSTWSYGICLDAGPPSTQVAVASAPGPSGTFTGVLATATCPPGTRLLSGGARTMPGTIGSLKPNGSFPSDASGAPVLSGANPTSWTAAGLNGGAGDTSNTTRAFAACATGGAANPTITVRNARVDGPGAASTGAQATTSCPPGTALVVGGAYISDHFALAGSQGDHLTGSFPSDPSGAPVTAGAASSWTASSHTGGTISGDLTDTNAWALCAGEPGGQAGDGAGGETGGPAPDAPPPLVVAPTGPIAGGVTTAQIRESMRRQMTPTGAGAKIAVLLRKGGATLPFRSLDAGRLVIRWSTAPTTVRGRRTKAILVAQGRRTFARSGARTVHVRLTPAGRRALRHATRLRLTAVGTFTRANAKPIVGSKGFVVTRHAATATR